MKPSQPPIRLDRLLLLAAILLASLAPAFALDSPTHVVEELQYSSTVDKTAPLYETAVFIADGTRKPILVIMHGFGAPKNDGQVGGGGAGMVNDLRAYAARGLFCIAPDMRGHGKSAGQPDASGLDVHDIVDGIHAAIAKHPTELDARNINMLGGSGGGGNCFAAFTRFPDTFHVIASFFGISDYGEWARSAHRESLRQVLDGTPEEKPQPYAARNFVQAAGNNRKTRFHIFWDEAETVCPAVMNDRFLEAYLFAGGTNVVAHISRAGSPERWAHGYCPPNVYSVPAEELGRDMKAPVPDLSLPRKGTLTVCGYLVCRPFQVIVEDGTRGVVKIEYDITGRKPKVVVTENPDKLKVTITPRRAE